MAACRTWPPHKEGLLSKGCLLESQLFPNDQWQLQTFLNLPVDQRLNSVHLCPRALPPEPSLSNQMPASQPPWAPPAASGWRHAQAHRSASPRKEGCSCAAGEPSRAQGLERGKGTRKPRSPCPGSWALCVSRFPQLLPHPLQDPGTPRRQSGLEACPLHPLQGGKTPSLVSSWML